MDKIQINGGNSSVKYLEMTTTSIPIYRAAAFFANKTFGRQFRKSPWECDAFAPEQKGKNFAQHDFP